MASLEHECRLIKPVSAEASHSPTPASHCHRHFAIPFVSLECLKMFDMFKDICGGDHDSFPRSTNGAQLLQLKLHICLLPQTSLSLQWSVLSQFLLCFVWIAAHVFPPCPPPSLPRPRRKSCGCSSVHWEFHPSTVVQRNSNVHYVEEVPQNDVRTRRYLVHVSLFAWKLSWN